jgi:hypothetical protein
VTVRAPPVGQTLTSPRPSSKDRLLFSRRVVAKVWCLNQQAVAEGAERGTHLSGGKFAARDAAAAVRWESLLERNEIDVPRAEACVSSEYSLFYIVFYNFYNSIFHLFTSIFGLSVSTYSLFYIILYHYHVLFLLFNNNIVNINCKS